MALRRQVPLFAERGWRKIEKGATLAPFYRRERLDYRFFPAFFFPPLAFFAIVCYPPLHVGYRASAHDHQRRLPPGTLTGSSTLVASVLGMASTHHRHTRCRLWTCTFQCQAQMCQKSQNFLRAITCSYAVVASLRDVRSRERSDDRSTADRTRHSPPTS